LGVDLTRLTNTFDRLRERGEKALVCFVTAGDPSAELTVETVKTLARAGVDAVEIGLPFSDPLADGPSIQASSQRALDRGMTTRKALEIVSRIRADVPNLPLILMTYYNPIRCFGLEAYAAAAKSAGADAHIVTDLTPEEASDWKRYSDANGLDTVFLLAPTSTTTRVDVVSKISTGFVYCVSRTGVTGAQQDVPVELMDVVNRIKSRTDEPVCVGFGISTPEHVKKICAFADGAVVGSSLVDLLHRERENPKLQQLVYDYVSALKAATKPEMQTR
jgi:tryptophan synthase alpha chain